MIPTGYMTMTRDFKVPTMDELLAIKAKIEAEQPKDDVAIVVIPKGAKLFYIPKDAYDIVNLKELQ